MAYKLQIRRGILSALPIGISGEPLFATDTNDLYISNGTTNQKFQKFIASGTSSQFLKGDGSLDSTTYQPLLINPVTGTGTTNYLPKWTSGSALGNSLVYDDGTNVGIGTISPAYKLDVAGEVRANNLFRTIDGSGNVGIFGSSAFASNVVGIGSGSNCPLVFGTNSTERARITSAGNLLVGTTVDSGYKLDVNGSGRFSGNIISDGGTIAAFNAGGIEVYNSGNSNFFDLKSTGGNFALRTNVGASAVTALSIASTGAATFSSSVTATNSILVSNTINAYAYQNFGANNTYGWQIGKADNSGGIAPSNGFYIYDLTNIATRLAITSGGNLLVGTTTDSGEKLQVSGSAKFTGNVNLANGFLRGYDAYGGLVICAETTATNNMIIINGALHPFSPNKTFFKVGGVDVLNLSTGAATFSSDVTISGVLQETVTTNRQTASYTLALADRGKLVEMNVATANNLTVPLNSSIAFPIGTKIDLAQYGAGQTTVVATGGVTVRSAGGALKLTSQYSGATLVKIATDEWYLFGNITV